MRQLNKSTHVTLADEPSHILETAGERKTIGWYSGKAARRTSVRAIATLPHVCRLLMSHCRSCISSPIAIHIGVRLNLHRGSGSILRHARPGHQVPEPRQSAQLPVYRQPTQHRCRIPQRVLLGLIASSIHAACDRYTTSWISHRQCTWIRRDRPCRR